jgi:YHS domain-containing protein
MRTNALALATMVLAAAIALPALAAEQTACPVSGETIDKATSPDVDWEGQRIYFCCANCPPRFKANPEKYFMLLAEAGVELENVQTACPVSGEELGGEMGDPVTVAHRGRTVRLCCAMCRPKLEKDPAKYLATLPGEQQAPAREQPGRGAAAGRLPAARASPAGQWWSTSRWLPYDAVTPHVLPHSSAQSGGRAAGFPPWLRPLSRPHLRQRRDAGCGARRVVRPIRQRAPRRPML